MADEYRLTIEILNDQPVLLEDFTRSFGAVADEYSDYVQKHGAAPPPDAQLYVREIRAGSIIVDLVARHGPALAMTVLPFVEHANTVIQFAGYRARSRSAYLARGVKRDDTRRSIIEP
jgi:hypothetical protein